MATRWHASFLGVFAAWAAATAAFAEPAALTLPAALDQSLRASPPPGEAYARRLAVTRHFFEALVADARYAAANERMAVDYVVFNRARQAAGSGWGEVLSVRELEARYLAAREARHAAQQEQQLARLALSMAMNSSAVPGELEAPPAAKPPALPDRAALEALMVERSDAWRDAGRLAEPERRRARELLRLELHRAALDVERVVAAVLPKLESEDAMVQLRNDRARAELDKGRRGELGPAMVAASELAARRVHAEGELAVALARLEQLLQSPAARWAAPPKEETRR